MRCFSAFMKKECMEVARTGRFYILMLIFFMFGIMNPMIAKLTPWLMEMMSEQLADSGLILGEANITALTSWEQFYKNIPMALIAFTLLFAGIYATEYQRGTLVLAISKGASKTSILIAKTVTLLAIWTLGYALSYVVTYGYNEFYWDNSIAEHCFYGAFLFWLFGVNIIAMMVLAATLTSGFGGTLLVTALYVGVMYLVGMVPKIAEYLPTKLAGGLALNMGTAEPEEFTKAIIVAVASSVVYLILARIAVNKKQF